MGVNVVIMQGRIGKDLEVKTLGNDTRVLNFSVALDGGKDKNGNSITNWINTTAFGRTAEFIGQYFAKGSEIVIEGHLNNRQYTAQDGSKREQTSVIVDRAFFSGSKQTTAERTTQAAFTPVCDDDLPF